MARTYIISGFIFILLCALGFAVGLMLHEGQLEKKRVETAAALEKAEDLIVAETERPFMIVDSIAAHVQTVLETSPASLTEQVHGFLESMNIDEEMPNASHFVVSLAVPAAIAEQTFSDLNSQEIRWQLGYPEIDISALALDRFSPDDLVLTSVISHPFRPEVYGSNSLAHPGRAKLIRNNLRFKSVAVSPPLDLMTGGRGFIISRNVFRHSEKDDLERATADRVLGTVTVPYQVDELLFPVKEQLSRLGFDVKIFDGGQTGRPNGITLSEFTLIASTFDEPLRDGTLLPLRQPDLGKAIFSNIEIGRRVWTLAFWPKAPVTGAYQSVLFWIPVSVGAFTGLLGALLYSFKSLAERELTRRVRERTRELEETQIELQSSRDIAEKLSMSDPLTGLSNRRALSLFFERMKPRLADGTLYGYVVLFDIDHFKTINDIHGHDFGDRVLKSVAQVLRDVAPESGDIARLGGDEFSTLVPTSEENPDGGEFTAKLLAKTGKLASELGLKDLSISVGVTAVRPDDNTLSAPFRRADIALYEAKRTGRGRAVLYTRELGEAELNRQKAVADVVAGIEADEFVPYFQPVIDMMSGKTYGFEVLARWQHPTKGVLAPGAFWPALEDESVAGKMTGAVLTKAMELAGRLKNEGCTIGRIAFNATEGMLRDPKFASDLLGSAEQSGLVPHNLKIEVTERILLARDAGSIREVLARLSIAGVSVAFDDFGTGFASLSHLRDFPIDCVKIDRSFVTEIDSDAKARAIVSAVTAMSRDLGMTTVAEGIETRGCEKVLAALGCDYGQGFLYGRPMPAESLAEFIKCRATGLQTDAA